MMIFTQLTLFMAATVLPSCFIAMAAGFWLRRCAPKWRLMSIPGAHRVHAQPTPLGGGIAIWIGVIGSFALGHCALAALYRGDGTFASSLLGVSIPTFVQPHLPGVLFRMSSLWVLLGAKTVLMALGLLDDFLDLSWKLRLAVQTFVAAACVFSQDWRFTIFIDVPLLTSLLSVLWIVASINAFNMLDNMDGLSAGVACIVAAILGTTMLFTSSSNSGHPHLFIAGFLFVFVGSLLGFLWHNRPISKLFMGDAGSYPIGFLIGVSTILATYIDYDSQSRHAVLAPLCLMAIPFYDMITVILIRLRSGRSPFQGDTNHFSHRLVSLGLSRTQAVLTTYLVTATCGLGAVVLHQLDLAGAVIIVVLVSCVLAIVAILESPRS